MPDWESLWAINRIQGWDQGEVTPAVRDFLKDHPVPLGESLIVPGCGTGYDVVAFAKAGYKRVVGVDMAPTSTAKAIEYAADKKPWAAQVAALVRPGGYALVQMYPLREECSGPPYSWTVTAYCALLEPNFELVFINECDGIERRKAFEKLSLWRRRTPTQSESI
ncbi:hypothetical protein BSLG_002375 [Batrachochytrium salamandrivorans]|nr:hypothetical protein BSLG_002375 [Batrachochytrium salamandrivorans]